MRGDQAVQSYHVDRDAGNNWIAVLMEEEGGSSCDNARVGCALHPQLPGGIQPLW